MKFLTLTATLLLDFSCILHFTSASPNGALHPISIPLQRKRYVYNSDGIFNLTAALKAHSRTVKKFKWGFQQLIFNQIARHPELILGRIAAKYQNTAAGHQQQKQIVDRLKDEVASLGGSILGRLLKRQAEPLTNQGNQMWTGIIGVGSPEQEFIIDFDTGSADLWIPSSNCKSDACASKNRYDASASNSSSMQEEPFKISYGDGTSISGFKYNDCVSVAGLQIFNQTFSSASYLSSSMGEDPTDGILGLAYPSISHLNAPSILENAHAQGLIPSTTFSFSLSDEGSEIFLGGVDKSKYSGLIEYHAVTRKAYWQIGSASCYVNGRKISRVKYETVIDSGTTIMYGPKDIVTEIYGQVEGSSPVAEAEGLWKFPCSNTPIVAFTWSGGRQWKISPERMVLGKSETNDSLCIGAISGQSVGLDEDTWLLGDSFMTNVYSVFNPTLNTIGFANPRSQFVLNFDLL